MPAPTCGHVPQVCPCTRRRGAAQQEDQRERLTYLTVDLCILCVLTKQKKGSWKPGREGTGKEESRKNGISSRTVTQEVSGREALTWSCCERVSRKPRWGRKGVSGEQCIRTKNQMPKVFRNKRVKKTHHIEKEPANTLSDCNVMSGLRPAMWSPP